MKKLMILFTLVICLFLMTGAVSAVETLQQIGFGSFAQDGSSPAFLYYAGFDVPIVTKSESGFVLKTEITYVYADNFAGGEVQALRVMAYAEKDILSGTEKVDKVDVLYWRWWLGAGSGTWQFTKIENDLNKDGDDQSFGALGFRTGFTYRWLTLLAGAEVIQVSGADVWAPMIGFNFSF